MTKKENNSEKTISSTTAPPTDTLNALPAAKQEDSPPPKITAWGEETYSNNLSRLIAQSKDKMENVRRDVVAKTPDVFIRNAAVGTSLLHVGSELFMMKSGGMKFFKNTRNGGKTNILIDPPRNIYRGITGADREKSLQNHWSIRSTTSGFSMWVLGSAIPDPHKEAPTESDENTPKPEEPAHGFSLSQIPKAFNITDPNSKRQTIALGVTVAGVCSAISGFHNVNVAQGVRFKNIAQTISGCITTLAAAQLLVSNSDREGWERYGATIWLHTPIAFETVRQKYAGGDRWGYYALGKAGFQVAALFAYFIAGAEEKGKEADPKATDVKEPNALTDTEKKLLSNSDTPTHDAPHSEPVATVHEVTHSPDRLSHPPVRQEAV